MLRSYPRVLSKDVKDRGAMELGDADEMRLEDDSTAANSSMRYIHQMFAAGASGCQPKSIPCLAGHNKGQSSSL